VQKALLNNEGRQKICEVLRRFVFLCPEHFKLGVANERERGLLSLKKIPADPFSVCRQDFVILCLTKVLRAMRMKAND
jgi:hypothetical protein